MFTITFRRLLALFKPVPPLPKPSTEPLLPYPPGAYQVEHYSGGWSLANIRYLPPSREPEVYLIGWVGGNDHLPKRIKDFRQVKTW